MNKPITYTLILLFFFGFTAVEASLPDTVVTVTGKVTSKDDNTPIKALIEYKKLPYGSEVGKISSDDNGEYTIYLHGDSKYSFKVSSAGYFAHTEQLVIDTNALDGKDISLSGGDAGYVFRLDNLIFAAGDDKINAQSNEELNGLTDRLNEYPNMVIQLEGHTDTQGNANQNMALSERRVQSVKTYLTAKGITGERIRTRAYGGTKPLSTEDTEEAHIHNRRVEVRIISVN